MMILFTALTGLALSLLMLGIGYGVRYVRATATTTSKATPLISRAQVAASRSATQSTMRSTVRQSNNGVTP